MSDLLRRHSATKATLGRYRGKAADWRTGITCVHLARFHLRQMGRKVPSLPRVRSEFAAVRELKARGWRNVADMLDSILERIPPARMALGDLAVVGSADGIGSIMVCAGPHKLLGWREDAVELVTLDVTLDQFDGAWRA
jgi:hypothetical protein